MSIGSTAASPVLRGVGSVLAPPGRCAALSILVYHRVLEEEDPLRYGEVDAKEFSWQMEALASHFNVLPLREAIFRLQEGTLPARTVSITFDDGYADNVEIALPILKNFGLPATFFVASGFLDGGCMWNDVVIESVRKAQGKTLRLREFGLDNVPIGSVSERRAAVEKLLIEWKYQRIAKRDECASRLADGLGVSIPASIMMRSEQVKALDLAGMEIGAHTVNHPILARLGKQRCYDEILQGRVYLESLLGKAVESFAYPNGKPGQDYNAEHVNIVRELGFGGAVSTAWGVATRKTDIFQLPRFTPWDKTPGKFVGRLLQNFLKRDLRRNVAD